MPPLFYRFACGLPLLIAVTGCTSAAPVLKETDTVAILNRLTWGVNDTALRQANEVGINRYVQSQLHPPRENLPPEIASRLAAMSITRQPVEQLLREVEQARKEFKNASEDDKAMARKDYQAELNQLAREAASRSLLRAIYSPNQLQEQLTWFWLNHFNVHQGKGNLRALVGDYEERAIRPYALGKFRDLLAATVHHPAMLRYLDNAQNARERINENYARELMELHTLGVGSGYTQRDVQELARVLTGVGVSTDGTPPRIRPALQSQYVRQGLFEFNPNRHDYGDKVFLGEPVRARGLAEVDEAIARLARHPATARFISQKLATYFVADEPAPALVERMAATFLASDGDIAAIMETMIASPEFTASLGRKFKDPQHFAVGAIRLAYDNRPVDDLTVLLGWLNRMGEPLYGHQTPDGYPMVQSAWASSGQMTTRFDIARILGTGRSGLVPADIEGGPKARVPSLSTTLTWQQLQSTFSPATRRALEQAESPQDWNTYFIAAPEMMYR
ncbi:MAG TPA: DUF1800 domain-containing protein [Telluria sp.]|nr:DUF1800 domain-containing protein [Telluria sp.]